MGKVRHGVWLWPTSQRVSALPGKVEASTNISGFPFAGALTSTCDLRRGIRCRSSSPFALASLIVDVERGSMCDTSSSRTNLDHIAKQARDLLHGLQRRDTVALRRYYSVDPAADMSKPRLDDAQYVIAREHGCASWRKLKERLHTSGSSENC
jgi:hypothetical protein